MTRKTILTAVLLVLFGIVIYAQDQKVTMKITDLNKVTTTIQNASTSSSNCGSSEFPVYQGSSLTNLEFADLTWISVRHDLTPSDPNYKKVEITFKDGKTGIYEMVKYIRFTGTTEEENFAIMVKEVNTIEVVQKR